MSLWIPKSKEIESCSQMDDILHFLGEQWLGLLIFAIGIPIAIIINRKAVPKKKLGYAVKTTEIMSRPGIDRLKVLYDNMPVSNLHQAKIFIQNHGKTLIKKDDVVDDYPVRITTQNHDIIVVDQMVLEYGREANSFKINQGLEVDFEYINPGDYCIINILFTIPKTSRKVETFYRFFSVEGELEGVQKISKLRIGFEGIWKWAFLSASLILFTSLLVRRYSPVDSIQSAIFSIIDYLVIIVVSLIGIISIIASSPELLQTRLARTLFGGKIEMLKRFE